MNGKCFDIGTIQAFVDGESSPDARARLTEHIADCTACSQLLAVAEDENSFVFSALEREMNSLVPTQRLWSRINESIEVEKSRAPFWQQIYAFFATQLASPSLTAAAGVLVVFGLVAVIWNLQSNVQVGYTPQVAQENESAVLSPQTASVQTASSSSDSQATVPPTQFTQVKASNIPPDKLEKLVKDANARNAIRPQPLVYNGYLPGEESYVKTISDLKQSVDGQKDAVFTPSSRVSFERDLAVVNDAISRMKKVVKKNPKNQAARQVLYSAYQDKIDLLNSVAQREELMASIR